MAPHRERVLPTGHMHIVLRLSESPLTLFDTASGESSRRIGHSVVGGARSTFYVKQAGEGACAVGVQLQPGGAAALLGVPAGEFAEQHTPLDAVWGLDVERLRERMCVLSKRTLVDQPLARDSGMRAQVDLLESFLLARLWRDDAHERGLGWLTYAIDAVERGGALAAIVETSGVSHRTFITRFRNMVGLSPKVFARVRRFQRVVDASSQALLGCGNGDAPNGDPCLPPSLARLALDAGYADQAHMSRDFLEFAGVSPSAYSRLAPLAPNHVPVRL